MLPLSALITATLLSAAAQAQGTPSAEPPAPALFAVEITTGPAWDNAKPPQAQAHFREHSANLKRLRDEGHLLVGARYADKGLVLLRAATADAAHAMMQQDPAMQAKVFRYELHEFRVFYPGTVPAAPVRPQ